MSKHIRHYHFNLGELKGQTHAFVKFDQTLELLDNPNLEGIPVIFPGNWILQIDGRNVDSLNEEALNTCIDQGLLTQVGSETESPEADDA